MLKNILPQHSNFPNASISVTNEVIDILIITYLNTLLKHAFLQIQKQEAETFACKKKRKEHQNLHFLKSWRILELIRAVNVENEHINAYVPSVEEKYIKITNQRKE